MEEISTSGRAAIIFTIERRLATNASLVLAAAP
jgi:hypothetical protein